MGVIWEFIYGLFKALFEVIVDSFRTRRREEVERADSDFGDASRDSLSDSLSGTGTGHNSDSGDPE